MLDGRDRAPQGVARLNTDKEPSPSSNAVVVPPATRHHEIGRDTALGLPYWYMRKSIKCVGVHNVNYPLCVLTSALIVVAPSSSGVMILPARTRIEKLWRGFSGTTFAIHIVSNAVRCSHQASTRIAERKGSRLSQDEKQRLTAAYLSSSTSVKQPSKVTAGGSTAGDGVGAMTVGDGVSLVPSPLLL